MASTHHDRISVSVYMDTALVDDLDTFANRYSVSRSELLRRVAKKFVEKAKSKQSSAENRN